MQLYTHTHQLLHQAQTLQLSAMLDFACAWMKHYLKALHPKATVFHLEQELLSQNALKLTQGVLVRPQPQLKGLSHYITTKMRYSNTYTS